MIFKFHPDAEKEFLYSIDYYEKQQEGLGFDYAHEIYSAIESIINYPETWPIIYVNIRRRLINRFPYGILYVVEDDLIYILAIMHLKRHPDYWIKRI